MRALRNGQDLAERVDQAAFSEALDRLNGHPGPLRLPPAISAPGAGSNAARWHDG
jgi:hypothetical protein